ncbi:MAG: N-acetylglucosamine-6-phosphate deacetylase [Eubacteriales bacterium]|nr:N-acetylglucosamine-6-phosphate deacetylase [Eubacteriales bacterium]
MIFTNGKIVNRDFDIVDAEILVADGRIAKIAPYGTICRDGQEVVDCTGKILHPGFVDSHIHGCNGADTGDATPEALETMSRYLAKHGVTSFCPSSMTVSHDELVKIFKNVRACAEKGLSGAVIRGINMEGPFIAESKKGAQAATNIRKPDAREFFELNEVSGGLIREIDIAPEVEGSDEFIREVAPHCTVSLAHSDATYEQAVHAFEVGITHATHLFNQMNGLAHRKPGAVGAIFDTPSVRAELICDGFHIHPAVLRTAFKVLGEDRSVVVSDSLKAAGCPDGTYDLGGQPVYVRDGKAFMPDGAIAASTANIYIEFKNLLSFGVPLRQVMKSCTINPAKEIRADAEVGTLEEGKVADILVFGGDWELEATYIAGKLFA